MLGAGIDVIEVGSARAAGDVRGPAVQKAPLRRQFWSARLHLIKASEHRRDGVRLWNEIRAAQPFSAWLEDLDDHRAELWCGFDPPEDRSDAMAQSVGAFAESIKAALDCAVAATAVANCGVGLARLEHHSMPLCRQEGDFDELPYEGGLMGLRPDQRNHVRELQPFNSRSGRFMQHHAEFLANVLDAARAGTLRCHAWVVSGDPEPHLPEGFMLEKFDLDPPGMVERSRRLATLSFSPRRPPDNFSGNPEAFFEPVLDVEPWPAHIQDDLTNRMSVLSSMARAFIETMERSTQGGGTSSQLRALDGQFVDEPAKTWLPVHFETPAQEREALVAIEESDQGLALFDHGRGDVTYLRMDGGRVVGREIGRPKLFDPGVRHGSDVEDAARAVAARWGLPDFVLKPIIIPKGSGRREVGDGTIVSGNRGVALQVKARSVPDDSLQRATSWLKTNAAAGIKQGRGTIRMFNAPAMSLENLRDRPVVVATNRVDWVPIVVLDHPTPPWDIVPDDDGKGPFLAMLRRDWEFLWNELRSASAVVDYVHRVASDPPIELGAETHRFLELAGKDLVAPPSDLPPWMATNGTVKTSVPMLPTGPASALDELGFKVFQRMLEDIASTDFTGAEADRIWLLAMVDRVAVAERAALGRLLLRRLIACSDSDDGALRVEHRLLYLDHGNLHLSFTTMGRLTGYDQELWRNWFLHRRQRFLQEAEAKGPVWPWSAGVLLTPSPIAGERLWDTTVIATNGPPDFDAAEYARLDALYDTFVP